MKLIATATLDEILILYPLTYNDHMLATSFCHYKSSPEIYYMVTAQDGLCKFDIFEMNTFDRIRLSST